MSNEANTSPTFLSTDKPEPTTLIHWFTCPSEDEPGETFTMGLCVTGETGLAEGGDKVQLVDCDCNPDADDQWQFTRLKRQLVELVSALPCGRELCAGGGDSIRIATYAERAESLHAGAEGWIEVDGLPCYVD